MMATKIKKGILYACLILLALICFLPFMLMIVNATRSGVEITHSFTLIPSSHLKDNWEALFAYVNLFKGFRNSLVVAIPATILTAYFSSITAYAMAVYRFKGNGWLFKIMVVFMMIPAQLSLIGFLIGLYPVLLVVSNIVSKPLYTLRVAMENFMQGDFSQKVEVMTQDEVGEASACFNRMVDDIRELIDKNYVLAIKERESELDTLQAQINPHFLYNTLDSLYWKATESGNDEIAEDILSLSQLFRLVLNRGDGIVTVRTEAELLERYLHIQKMRFGKRLAYEISLEQEILEEEIPKLILQPFVENAIVHGFESAEGSYKLSVIGIVKDKKMIFRIIDTGVGMSGEQLEAIWEKADARKYASQRIGRYAIRNVKERLELIYHENYELQIDSRVGCGTTVVVVVPCGLKEIRRNEH